MLQYQNVKCSNICVYTWTINARLTNNGNLLFLRLSIAITGSWWRISRALLENWKLYGRCTVLIDNRFWVKAPKIQLTENLKRLSKTEVITKMVKKDGWEIYNGPRKYSKTFINATSWDRILCCIYVLMEVSLIGRRFNDLCLLNRFPFIIISSWSYVKNLAINVPNC